MQPHDPEVSHFPNTGVRSFVALEDNKTFIISTYHDSRQFNLLRILAIVHKTVKNIYCLFHCKQNVYLQGRANIDIFKDNFGFPYQTANILCPSPPQCDYDYMSVHTNSSTDMRKIPIFKIQKDHIGSFSANFTVCISALYGKYNNALQVIQAIEMYKLLGASRVTIYNISCHENVDKILKHYIREGVVEVVPWPIDKYLKTSKKWKYVKGLDSEIGYYGQIASLNDCMYRNMYKSEFVLLNDIDEIIIPIKHWDWSSLMGNLQKRYPQTSVFRFENHAFPSSINATGPSLWNHVPGINILQYPYREPGDEMSIKPRKMIVNPRKVIQTSIHSVLKAEGYSTDVSREDGILFHCKAKRNMKIPEKDLIRDDILLRYNISLVPNIDKIVQKLFPQH
ncbi:beta-1,4-galactosyltransferase galt-1-like [Engystomops pustulosus]|uniref:beta-1,4-galactosyltransferase galt-1-like n=1 Tax=Engystomops pustulosus TaxID=76066 RepID=UPI003AFB1B3E